MIKNYLYIYSFDILNSFSVYFIWIKSETFFFLSLFSWAENFNKFTPSNQIRKKNFNSVKELAQDRQSS